MRRTSATGLTSEQASERGSTGRLAEKVGVEIRLDTMNLGARGRPSMKRPMRKARVDLDPSSWHASASESSGQRTSASAASEFGASAFVDENGKSFANR